MKAMAYKHRRLNVTIHSKISDQRRP